MMRVQLLYYFGTLLLAWVFWACEPITIPHPNSSVDPTLPSEDCRIKLVQKTTFSEPTPTIVELVDSMPPTSVPWLTQVNGSQLLQQQIAVPNGYQRLTTAPNSFAFWLRHLPLHPKGQPVLLYNGQQKPYQAGAYRVLNIDIGKRNLQQCADAVMRLRAEYLYSKKAYAAIHFNYTSGHTIRFSDWAKGKRPKVSGKNVYFSTPSGTPDYSYQQFKRYLTNVYNYAGTASLSKELHSKKIANIQAGNVFIQGGFPGHAVLVIDVAEHPDTGERLFLLAQSYMPAQSIHILHNFNDSERSPWYSTNFTGVLKTPEWNFKTSDLCQFFD